MPEKMTREVCERILTDIDEQQNLGSLDDPVRSDESGISKLRYGSIFPGLPLGAVCEGVVITQGHPALQTALSYSVRGLWRVEDEAVTHKVLWARNLEWLCTQLKRAGLDTAEETTTEDGYPAVVFKPSRSTVTTVLSTPRGVDAQWDGEKFRCYAEAEDTLRKEGFAFLCITNGGDAEIWTKLGAGLPTFSEDAAEMESPVYWLRRLRGRVRMYYEEMLKRDDFLLSSAVE